MDQGSAEPGVLTLAAVAVVPDLLMAVRASFKSDMLRILSQLDRLMI